MVFLDCRQGGSRNGPANEWKDPDKWYDGVVNARVASMVLRCPGRSLPAARGDTHSFILHNSHLTAVVNSMGGPVEFRTVTIEKPQEVNFILGQSHFIKTVEDIAEVVSGSVPGAKFGLAFCESSGDCLIRLEGNDDDLKAMARDNALAIGAGHSFILFLRDCYPINILNAIKNIQEVCTVYCATANPAEVIIAESAQGRGILGVIDGERPRGVEGPDGVSRRTALLRKFGYKRG